MQCLLKITQMSVKELIDRYSFDRYALLLAEAGEKDRCQMSPDELLVGNVDTGFA